MAITLVGAIQAISAIDGLACTCTFSPTPQIGDVVVVVGGQAATSSSYGPTTAGYTFLTGSSTTPSMGIWYKVLSAADTSVTMKNTGTATVASAYVVMVLRGVDNVNPFENSVNASTTLDPASFTCSFDNSLCVQGYAVNVATAPTAGPSGYINLTTKTSTDTAPYACGVATKIKSPAGAEDAGVWTNPAGTARRTVSGAFRAAAVAASEFEGWGVPI